MKKEIDIDILEATKRCCFDFQCLKENGKPRCEVEYVIIGAVFFVKCLLVQSCNYLVSCGDDIMCLCPTRAELYLKYKI